MRRLIWLVLFVYAVVLLTGCASNRIEAYVNQRCAVLKDREFSDDGNCVICGSPGDHVVVCRVKGSEK